ncbi:MAG: hypothetical protein JSS76_08865 [Bacteroidetes bacterium]|nr:hypothetical protein [Bacteroidota bacterium]
MKEKTKIALGVLAGAAAGVAVGYALSDQETIASLKDTLAEAVEQFNLKLQNMIENSQDYLGDLKDKVTDTTDELTAGIQNMEG